MIGGGHPTGPFWPRLSKGQCVHINPSQGSSATILVVDDDALITLNTVDVLTELGHSALEAYSAREALRLVAERPDIDLLITDYGMPDMNGIELAAAARAMRPDLPILLATGYAELPDGQASTYPRLEKPFRGDELAGHINELLRVPAAG